MRERDTVIMESAAAYAEGGLRGFMLRLCMLGSILVHVIQAEGATSGEHMMDVVHADHSHPGALGIIALNRNLSLAQASQGARDEHLTRPQVPPTCSRNIVVLSASVKAAAAAVGRMMRRWMSLDGALFWTSGTGAS